MKRNLSTALVILLAACLMTKADVPVFGNSTNGTSGINIIVRAGSSIQEAAIEFTPLENIDLSSVTVWLSGYNGMYGQTVFAGIYNNSSGNTFGNAPNIPGNQLLGFTSPAANDGSLASFTFSNPTGTPYNPTDSTILSANTPYWLLIGATGEPGSYEDDNQLWTIGGTPTGSAVYDGTVIYSVPGPNYNTSSIIPAFTINAVPEPGVAALLSIPVVFGLGRILYRRRTFLS